MREDIFYWKCDCPLDLSQQEILYFADKYHSPKILNCAKRIASDFLQTEVTLTSMKCAGNHFAFRFRDHQKEYFLRMDDGITDDEYMLAESAVMTMLRKHGLPVPVLYETDISQDKVPFRWQIMEAVNAPSLNTFAKQGILNDTAIAVESGRFLTQLHEITGSGWGFLNTETIKLTGHLEGLDRTPEEYFQKRLCEHIAYLYDLNVLPESLLNDIVRLLHRKIPLLKQVKKPSFLHRDFAYWNILGTTESILSVVDWDDAVLGDPADDLGIVNCFHPVVFLETLLSHYKAPDSALSSFRERIALHTIRNMLWKMGIRHRLDYFNQDTTFFLSRKNGEVSLYDFSVAKIREELQILEVSK